MIRLSSSSGKRATIRIEGTTYYPMNLPQGQRPKCGLCVTTPRTSVCKLLTEGYGPGHFCDTANFWATKAHLAKLRLQGKEMNLDANDLT